MRTRLASTTWSRDQAKASASILVLVTSTPSECEIFRRASRQCIRLLLVVHCYSLQDRLDVRKGVQNRSSSNHAEQVPVARGPLLLASRQHQG